MSTTSSTTNGFDLALIRCAAGTDVGMRREENQDCFGIIKRADFQAFFIADGMGGAQGGATASRMAIGCLQEALGPDGVMVSLRFLDSAIKETNQRIFDKGSTEPEFAGMGTTLVGLVFTPNGVISVNVGDSRAYRVHNQTIEQVSTDHTLLSALIESGNLDRDEAQGHPVSHMLTRSLGPIAEVEVECRLLPEPPQNGDIYLLCSDGLYNYVPPEEILSVVRQNALDDANQILINLANQRGGADNITVLVISVGEKSPRGRKPSLPYPLVDIDQPNFSDEAQEVSSEPVKQGEMQIPPPVEEPKGHRLGRRLAKTREPSYILAPRLIPSVILLGSTLLIGLVLGSLLRRISLGELPSFWASMFQPSTSAPVAQEEPTPEQSADQEGSALATLAKQIRAERNSEFQGDGDPKVSRTPEQIQAAIRKLEQQIQALNSSNSGILGINSDAIKAEVDRLQRDYSAIEANLDVASRAVTLWLSRQVAFESQSKSDGSLADIEQVAAYSATIKEKLSNLSTISYQFRSKADEVELYPSNLAIRADLEQLQAKRDQLRSELQIDVRRSLGSILANAYKDYETIKIRRDMLWLDLQAVRHDLEIRGILADGDTSKREALLQLLRERLEVEKKLLNDLGRRNRAGR